MIRILILIPDSSLVCTLKSSRCSISQLRQPRSPCWLALREVGADDNPSSIFNWEIIVMAPRLKPLLLPLCRVIRASSYLSCASARFQFSLVPQRRYYTSTTQLATDEDTKVAPVGEWLNTSIMLVLQFLSGG